MSAFSFTAPTITPAQEQEEFEAFSDAEKKSIHDDLYGEEDSVLKESPSIIENAVSLFTEALHEIPHAEKSDYLEALERAPEVVRRECPAIKFLRADNFDAWAAARRLANYWKLRKQVFGPDRAFLPLTIEGAMNEDREILALGLIAAILPADRANRPIFFADRVKCTKALAHRDVYVRIIFYFLSILSNEEETQRTGFVFLMNSRGFDLYTHFDRIMTKRMVSCAMTVPVHIKGSHIVTGSGKNVVTLIMPVMKHLYGKRIRHRLKLHHGSDQEIIASLGGYGIPPSSITSLFGGEWKHHAEFQIWFQERLALERRRETEQKST